MTARREQIRALIQTVGSRFCTATFIKEDGSLRQMTIQPRVVSHIKGEDAAEDRQRAAQTRRENNPHLMNVWDVAKRAPRSINLDTLTSLVVDKQVYSFQGM